MKMRFYKNKNESGFNSNEIPAIVLKSSYQLSEGMHHVKLKEVLEEISIYKKLIAITILANTIITIIGSFISEKITNKGS